MSPPNKETPRQASKVHEMHPSRKVFFGCIATKIVGYLLPRKNELVEMIIERNASGTINDRASLFMNKVLRYHFQLGVTKNSSHTSFRSLFECLLNGSSGGLLFCADSQINQRNIRCRERVSDDCVRWEW